MMRVETIQIAAIRHKNGSVTVFGADGRRITTLSAGAVEGIADAATILWGEWARSQNHFKPNYTIRMSWDVWKKRIDAMRMSWKCRVQSLRKNKDSSRNAWKPSGTWKQSITSMMNQMSSARGVVRQREKNPFLKWAATSTRNANRRVEERYVAAG